MKVKFTLAGRNFWDLSLQLSQPCSKVMEIKVSLATEGYASHGRCTWAGAEKGTDLGIYNCISNGCPIAGMEDLQPLLLDIA